MIMNNSYGMLPFKWRESVIVGSLDTAVDFSYYSRITDFRLEVRPIFHHDPSIDPSFQILLEIEIERTDWVHFRIGRHWLCDRGALHHVEYGVVAAFEEFRPYGHCEAGVHAKASYHHALLPVEIHTAVWCWQRVVDAVILILLHESVTLERHNALIPTTLAGVAAGVIIEHKVELNHLVLNLVLRAHLAIDTTVVNRGGKSIRA
jgi:hypothetical protein